MCRKHECAVACFLYIDKMFLMEIVDDIQSLPDLGLDCIHVWGIHLPNMIGRIAALYAVLCEEEREKSDRFFRKQDRHSSIVARGALRILLSKYIDVPVDKIAFQYLETGKPYVEDSDVGFNVSHSAEWVLLAFGRKRQVGVDVEKIRYSRDVETIAERYFSPEEIGLINDATDCKSMFFQIWARKEAYVKALGSALFRELGSFSVPIFENELPSFGEKEGWGFHGLNIDPVYAAAIVTDRPFSSVSCFDFCALKRLQ